MAPEATYLAWLDCRELVARSGRCENPAQRSSWNQPKVALNDGSEFGPHGDGFARLNFATSAAMLDRVLDSAGHGSGCLASPGYRSALLVGRVEPARPTGGRIVDHVFEFGVAQRRTVEVCADQVGADEHCAVEPGVGQVGVAEV